MSLYILVYLISLIDNLQFLAGVTIFISGTALLFFIMFFAINLDFDTENLTPFLKRLFKILSISLLSAGLVITFVPSKQTAYVLVGLYVGETVVTNEKLNSYMDKALQIVDKELDKKLKELGVKDEVQN